MTSAITQCLQFSKEVTLGIANTLCKIPRLLYIIAVEAFATIRYVLPCAVSWLIKEKFSKEFTTFSFPLTIDKTQSTAKLFLYSNLESKENEGCTPLLFVHGDHGHPYTLHHLAQMAKGIHKGPIFSLYMPTIHHDAHFHEQGVFIDMIISTIEKMVQDKGGIFNGILAAGHSKGAMLLVERQFCSEQSHKILRTFAVAGPLKDKENCFSEPLKPIFKNLNQKIREYADRKFFQVIPKNDWSSPHKAMAVRPDEHCYSVPGMHLSGLYAKETTELFKKFLAVAA